MKKKVLITANLESFYKKFLIPQMEKFHEMGYEIYIATKLEGLDLPFVDYKYDVPFARGFNLSDNINSYKEMKKILKNEHFDIISCHTPFGGAITRLAYKNLHIKDTLMVYMAHGFHFYKGAPLFNWLIYYNAEKYLAKCTDRLITINLDDYEIAKEKFKCQVKLVNGVGLDTSKFDFKMSEKEKVELRDSLGIKKDDFVMIYAAELLPRKRQEWLINTLADILKEHSNFHLILPGKDSMNGKLEKIVNNLNLINQIHLLGFRKDIPKLLNIADIAVSSSKQEGLPVNIMEAMYVGLPIIATECRGNRDLIANGVNGYIIPLNNQKIFCDKVLLCYNMNNKEKEKINKENNKLIQKFLLENVINEIMNIYKGY